MGLEAPYVTSYLTEHFADDAYGTLDGYVATRRLRGREARRSRELTPDAGDRAR